ncbi:hypothetical protein MPTK1_3g25020 [Marchantia polymorpha subsp. ruderalis]|uniref:Uncharacterized protein n=2 Tax=Marchantia polymorpha TaxID=3197 RepID=A0AAF6B4I9_MARPO|nr:hypothetical protein MARPO_0100s0015 [Marchantia polymorpha]BBN06923.1 hypothetical protein Mp_3g25020 [Marchantia polymorpha subsp. ruderalis]|eukprot:PTQ32300.1 hypothetical protein MARPO_0100s0015 [Marchantia polymorpha]
MCMDGGGRREIAFDAGTRASASSPCVHVHSAAPRICLHSMPTCRNDPDELYGLSFPCPLPTFSSGCGGKALSVLHLPVSRTRLLMHHVEDQRDGG